VKQPQTLQDNFNLLARYNQWMNDKIYQLAATLSQEQLFANKGAFFGSVAGTLNHLLVADLIWLNRFRQLDTVAEVLQPLGQLPTPVALDQILYPDFALLHSIRQQLDQLLILLCQRLDEQQLQHILSYKNLKGEVIKRRLAPLLQHLFNHQTHHRGQITTLFSQLGLDIGVTDLFVLIDNED
jgi:uncharacterized damage-inducible protein DinB